MRFVLLSALLLGVVCPAMSQISGTVTHKQTRKPLNQAVATLSAQIGTLVLKTTTDASGDFMFPMPPEGLYSITVSFLGFQSKSLLLKIPATTSRLQLDTIQLAPSPLDLSQVEVKGVTPLVKVRGDTMEFNAKDFYTTEKAPVLNLLQKIPGLSVDLDGNFYFQGTPIRELYIDGRPAFQDAPDGNADPKVISRLLLASVVDKIQVTSKKQSPGLSPGSAQKVINITTRKESRKHINGEIGAGYATQNGYKVGGSAARFAEHSQLMATAVFANLSSMTLPSSADESMDMNMRFPGTTRDGKISLSAGFDARKKAKFNFTYNRMDRDGDLLEQQHRENFIPTGNYYYDNSTAKKNKMQANMLGTNFSYDFNEKNNLTVHGNLFLTRSDLSSANQFSTTGSSTLDTLSYGNFSNREHQDNQRAFLFGEYTRQFQSGGMFRVNINYDLDHNWSQQYNYSLNLRAANQPADTINQLIQPTARTHNLTLGVQLYKPISKKFYFQTIYNLGRNQIRNNQLASNYHMPSGKYLLMDSSLTYRFENLNFSQSLNASFSYHIGKFNATLGATYSLNDFSSSGSANAFNFSQHYSYLSPVVNLSWTFNPLSAMHADLSTSPLMPLTDRVVPVISVQNPLQVQLGNPDLKPGYCRRISLDYMFSDTHGTSFSIGIFATLEYNSVSTSVTTDSTGKQITRPINVDGTRAFSPMITYGKRFQKLHLTFSYRAFGDLRRSLSWIDGQENINRSLFLNHDISISWNCKSWLELSAVAALNYRGNQYSLQNNAYYHFSNNRIFLKAVFFLPAGIEIGSAGMYSTNSGLPGSITTVNGWISKLLFKQKNWLVKCYGFDLLNQSRTQMAVATPNFIDRTVSNSQRQYFMCSLVRYFK